jgi:hypothetical protein
MANSTTPVPPARRDYITTYGTWLEELPEGAEPQDHELLCVFVISKLSGVRND